MTPDGAGRGELNERRFGAPAEVGRDRASPVEPASRRWVARARRLALARTIRFRRRSGFGIGIAERRVRV